VFAWGNRDAARDGALGLGPSLSDAGEDVHTPRRIPNLRVACWLLVGCDGVRMRACVDGILVPSGVPVPEGRAK
jgi:hypothetical protein